MRHWSSRGQEKREGGANPALSLAVADWGWCCARRVCCAPLPDAMDRQGNGCLLYRPGRHGHALACVYFEEERRSSQRASLTPGSTDNLVISVTVLGAEMLMVAL
jgi:hypothetical protein